MLHVCCGPCATLLPAELEQRGFEVTLYFYNPNIHPYREFKRRLRALQELVAHDKLRAIYDERYRLAEFLRHVVWHEFERCRICYNLRQSATARLAAAEGFEWFSTTLLQSPYQPRKLISAAGKQAEAATGVRFLDEDFTYLFEASEARARELGLYMQSYCGCIYSEWERYNRRAAKHMRQQLEEWHNSPDS